MTGGVSPFLPYSDAVSREALETQLHSQGFEPSQLPLRWLTLTEVTQKPQLLEQVIVETVEPASRCHRSHQPRHRYVWRYSVAAVTHSRALQPTLSKPLSHST